MAPSPTGPLHVGTSRTALFNYLFARHHHGTFVLRIEDTDAQRNDLKWLPTIFEGFRWLGIDWDEGPQAASFPAGAEGSGDDYRRVARDLGNVGAFGPYYQSQRTEVYRDHAQRLLEAGAAYRCFCSKPVLAEDKARQEASGRPSYRYVGRCRELSAEEQRARAEAGETFALRLRVPESGELAWEDSIHGAIAFDCASQDDFFITATDGHALYNFTVVVDDVTMGITHALRGDDHISNTPKQLLLYRALGVEPPQFGHLPMINGPDGKKLSKRHGPTLLTEYGERGVLPEAMLNFIAFLGWSPGAGETQELFTRDELIARFSLEHVGRAAAIFNFEKLEWMNGQYLRARSMAELTDLCLPHLRQAGLIGAQLSPAERAYAEAVIALERDRLRYPIEIVEATRFFFGDEFDCEAKAVARWLTPEGLELLAVARARIEQARSFSHDDIEGIIRSLAAERGLSAAKLIHPLRVAVTGRTAGPGLFELMAVLGRDRCLTRLTRTLLRS